MEKTKKEPEKKAQEKKEEKKININDLEALKKLSEEYQKQRDEYLNGWKRERADFLNYKKDEIERIEKLIKYANEELLLKFLPILDNLCLAEKEIPEDLKNSSAGSLQVKWVRGILNIKTQILNFLKSQGVEEIKCLGQKFDPNFQEIIEGVETKDKESGKVIEEVQKGYIMYGRVIRPAKVKVVK